MPTNVPSSTPNLPTQPSLLPILLLDDNVLQDGDPTIPPTFPNDDSPCIAFHLTKEDYKNNIRPIGWLRPTFFDYLYRSFPKYNVGKRFVEFVPPEESESEDCTYLSDWVLKEGKEGIEWQMHKLTKHIRDEEEEMFPGSKKKWAHEPVTVGADPRSTYFKTAAYALSPKCANEPINAVFNVDRSVLTLFGFARMFANLMITRGRGDDLQVCLTTRSQTVSQAGLHDLGLGGGIGAGYTPFQALLKESYEEGGIDPEWLAKRYKSSGFSSSVSHRGYNYFYDYEVHLPDKGHVDYIELRSNDGEIEAFQWLSGEQVINKLFTDPTSFNGRLHTIAFLVRNHFINAENEPNYAEICSRIHRLIDFVAGPIWRIEQGKQLADKAMRIERKDSHSEQVNGSSLIKKRPKPVPCC